MSYLKSGAIDVLRIIILTECVAYILLNLYLLHDWVISFVSEENSIIDIQMGQLPYRLLMRPFKTLNNVVNSKIKNKKS